MQIKKIKDLDIFFFKGISPGVKTIEGDSALIPSGAVFPEGIKVEKTYKFFSRDCEVKDRYLENNDILFNCGGVGTLGRSALFNDSLFEIKAIPDSFILVIRSKGTTIISKYLYYYLQTDAIKNETVKNTKGTTGITSIRTSDVVNFLIPFPNISDQKRIVEILDQACSLIQKRKQSIELLSKYLDSIFVNMFGDQQTNPKSWTVKRLDEIADICSGVTKGRKFGDSKTVYTPYMRVANVQDEHIDLTEVKEIEVLPNDIKKYRLVNGDLLLTEGGDPDKLGRGGIWRGEIDNCIHQNHIFRVRFKSKIALPEYISAQIGSSRGKKYFLKSAKQTTGIATINITQLKDYPALIPPLDLQIKYSEIVKDLGGLKQKMAMQLVELENQFQALMQKAFKGELIN
jgi:type I restriction enzyme S subunit